MNNFLKWLDSGTAEQRNKKRFTFYLILVTAALLIITLLTLAIMGIVNAVKSNNNGEDIEGGGTGNPNSGYVTATFGENALYRGELINVDESHPYNADANADIERVTIEAGRAKSPDGGNLYSSNALDKFAQKIALDQLNKMLLDFYAQTNDDNIWVCMDSGAIYTAGNTFELCYTTGVSGAPKPSITGVDEYTWIFDHAHEYGFIPLYESPEASTGTEEDTPTDKTNIFRYVGEVHAEAFRTLKSKKHCNTFAQYLEYLRTETNNKSRLKVTVDKVNYEICYLPADNILIFEKYKDNYTVSGDNMGGYIVTYNTTTAKN